MPRPLPGGLDRGAKAVAERASLRLERISEAVSWGPAEKSP